jgi:hypothetical protein
MQVRDLEQALKLQEEFTAKVLDRVEALHRGSPPSPERIASDRERLLTRIEARLDAAVKERETAVRYWDERIARLKADIEQLGTGDEEIDQPKASPRRKKRNDA